MRQSSGLLAVRFSSAVLLLVACSGSSGDGDVASSGAAIGKLTTTLSIDATRLGFDIPSTYVGLSFSRSNISGDGGGERIFDKTSDDGNKDFDPQSYEHLVNLLQQIGVRHIRTVSDGAEDTAHGCRVLVDPTASQDDAFFRFAQDAGLGAASIIYSLHLFNEEKAVSNPSSTANNVTSAKHIWSSPYRSMVESFALDNEPDWAARYREPCRDPSVRGYDPSVVDGVTSVGYRDEWTRQANDVRTALGDPTVPFSGPDTGSNYPVSQGKGDTSIDKVPFTLRFAKDHTDHIDLATQHYYGGNNEGVLTAERMAEGMLDPARLGDYGKLFDAALAGAGDWPTKNGKKLPFRLTEANAYSGGTDPASHNFATALWSLDTFHWWAARGCVGVDPFTRVVQYNAPIYQLRNPKTQLLDFEAAPYAYGMLAFTQGSDGTTIDPGAIRFSSRNDRVTAYAVVNASHLFVTILNKTFRSVGSVDVTLTIDAHGFAAKHARKLVLESAPDTGGDASASTAVLGRATIPTTGSWQGTWDTNVKVNPDGTVGPVQVSAASAVILDLTRN